jgi:K+-sensing histidine kinase KdpD
MFEFPGSDSDLKVNPSLYKGNEKSKSMNSFKENMMNCPSVLTGMSHEIRTYMNAIVAFSYLMKENSNDDVEKEEYSNQILNSCEQLIDLFEGFLDSAIIDTGDIKSDTRSYRLDNILDDLLSEFRETLSEKCHKDIELVTEIQYSNSNRVIIDRSRIFRVIHCLFQNSIKNTKSGYIKIGYFQNNDKVTFYVLDSGQGYFKCKEFLNSEDLNDSLSQHNDTYTAINMTLAKKIIQMLGGTIWIECNGLAGAGIYFTIPVKVVTSDIDINRYNDTMIAI